MGTLAPRLKALAKRIALLDQGDPALQAALSQLEASLDEVERLLPPTRQRGRPKQREIALSLLRFAVDGIKALPDSGVKTDREALQWFLRRHKGRGNLKTWQNSLARARKLLR